MLYEYNCKCGASRTLIRIVADRNKTVKCSVCNKKMKLQEVNKPSIIINGSNDHGVSRSRI